MIKTKYKKIHIIGIGGIGISALTKFLIHHGVTITGSDLESSFITEDIESLGGMIYHGHSAKHISEDIEMVIYSDAIPEQNSERQRAKELNIPQMSYYQYLGEITKQYRTVAVSGNKGKTTVTAMLGHILQYAQKSPTVIVGSYVLDWNNNFLAGASDILITEACEFKDHFLALHTLGRIVTNIAPDHMDYFGSYDNEIQSFRTFLNHAGGWSILNADDKDSMIHLTSGQPFESFSIDLNSNADMVATEIEIKEGISRFRVRYHNQDLGNFHVRLPGRYNISNALCALLASLKLGVEVDDAKDALQMFHGTWRRFQILGHYKEALIISDYAHHPKAVLATLAAAKEFYPNRRIVLAFHPHHHQRTRDLFLDFVESFDLADLLILNEIFAVAGRDEISNKEVSSSDLVDAVLQRDKQSNRVREVYFGKNLRATRSLLDKHIQKDDIVIVMGAGDLYKVAEAMVETTT